MTFKDFLRENSGYSKSNLNESVYSVRICDGRGAASRGRDTDTIETVKVQAKDDLEAWNKILKILIDEYDAWFDEDIDISKYKVKDFEEWNDSIDVGDGSPFIFWIKKGSKKIYDSGLEESNEY